METLCLVSGFLIYVAVYPHCFSEILPVPPIGEGSLILFSGFECN